MNKSKKILGLFLSVLFAVGAIIVGTVYDNNRKKSLEVQSVTKSSTDILVEKETKTKINKSKEEVSGDSNKIEESEINEELTNEQLVALDDAQALINVIIVDGQVQSNFTLDDYRAAKAAVEALDNSAEKEELNTQIIQIETALTNMGIAY